MRAVPVAAFLALFTLPPCRTAGQRLAQPVPMLRPWAERVAQDSANPEPSVGRPILLGTALGVAGWFAGFLIGGALSDECDRSSDYCIEDAEFLGAAAGGTLGLATGVHLGNRRRGSLALDFLVSSAVWGAGIASAFTTDNDHARVAILVAIPIVQLGTTIALERATGRKRHGT